MHRLPRRRSSLRLRLRISPTEGSELARLVDTYVRAVEASDLDKRLRAIEEKMAK